MKLSAANPLDRSFDSMRQLLIAVGVFSFAINLLALTVPMHMMHVYDHVLTSHSGATLLFITLLAAGLLAALGLIELFRSRILVRMAARLDSELGDRLFATAVTDRLAGRSGSPAQSLRDLDTLRHFVSGSALPVLFDAPWAPVFIGLTFLLHPLLGSVALAGALVLLATTLCNERTTRRLSNSATNDTIAAAAYSDSALRNAEVIQAMGMAPAIIGRWRNRQDAAVYAHAAMADRSGSFVAIAKFWRPFLQIGMLATGAWLAIENIITPGVMIASSIIMARALAPVEGAIGSWRGFVTARGAYARLRETMARYSDTAARMPLPALRGEIHVSNLFVAPPRTVKPVLKGVSFSLASGEALGVIGPSASGKSTLARALVGAWPILSGEIRLDGTALADLDRTRIGRQIGYLPQDIELFDGTVAENIVRFGEPDPEGVLAATRLAGLHDLILRLPQAYNTPIGPGGEALSGGQRQRIALARALYGKPAFLILDEPNANLDVEGEDALLAAISAVKSQGAAVVVIAHRPNIIAAVERILVLRAGAVEALGPRTEVLARFTMRRGPRDGAPVVATIVGR